MKLEKEYIVDVHRQKVWESIWDLDVLAGILPGCKSIAPVGNDHYTADFAIKVGPVKGEYDGKLQVFDKEPPRSCRFKVTGDGSTGHMRGNGNIELREEDGKTLLKVVVEGNVGGIIARVGQRLIEATGKKLMDQAFINFKKQVEEEQ